MEITISFFFFFFSSLKFFLLIFINIYFAIYCFCYITSNIFQDIFVELLQDFICSLKIVKKIKKTKFYVFFSEHVLALTESSKSIPMHLLDYIFSCAYVLSFFLLWFCQMEELTEKFIMEFIIFISILFSLSWFFRMFKTIKQEIFFKKIALVNRFRFKKNYDLTSLLFAIFILYIRFVILFVTFIISVYIKTLSFPLFIGILFMSFVIIWFSILEIQ